MDLDEEHNLLHSEHVEHVEITSQFESELNRLNSTGVLRGADGQTLHFIAVSRNGQHEYIDHSLLTSDYISSQLTNGMVVNFANPNTTIQAVTAQSQQLQQQQLQQQTQQLIAAQLSADNQQHFAVSVPQQVMGTTNTASIVQVSGASAIQHHPNAAVLQYIPKVSRAAHTHNETQVIVTNTNANVMNQLPPLTRIHRLSTATGRPLKNSPNKLEIGSDEMETEMVLDHQQMTAVDPDRKSRPKRRISSVALPHKKRIRVQPSKADNKLFVLHQQQEQQQQLPQVPPSSVDASAESTASNNTNMQIMSAETNRMQQTDLSVGFTCEICLLTSNTQLEFFRHLKLHYEPVTLMGVTAAQPVGTVMMDPTLSRQMRSRLAKIKLIPATSSQPTASPAIINATAASVQPQSVQELLEHFPSEVEQQHPNNDQQELSDLTDHAQQTSEIISYEELDEQHEQLDGDDDDEDSGDAYHQDHMEADPESGDDNTQQGELEPADCDGGATSSSTIVRNEFSDTEDMFEGIRGAVDKVQQSVDHDLDGDDVLVEKQDWFDSELSEEIIFGGTEELDDADQIVDDNHHEDVVEEVEDEQEAVEAENEEETLDLSQEQMLHDELMLKDDEEEGDDDEINDPTVDLETLEEKTADKGRTTRKRGAAAGKKSTVPTAASQMEYTEEISEATGKKSKGKRSYKCRVCDKLCQSKNSMHYHFLSHTGERPHQCEECGKGFFANSALKVHMRLHTGDKPYNCEVCGRAFRQWGDLKYHMTSLHSDEKNHQCEFCGKDFARRYSLVIHRRIHTGERNYKCEFCGKAFRASTYLQDHRRIHTGEKPHDCEYCGKKFRVRGDLKRHWNIHTRGGAKPPTGAKATGAGDETKASDNYEVVAASIQIIDNGNGGFSVKSEEDAAAESIAKKQPDTAAPPPPIKKTAAKTRRRKVDAATT